MAGYTSSLFLALSLAMAACERPAPPAAPAGGAGPYDLTAYLQQQKQRLQAEQPMLLKSVQTGKQPTETIETGQVDWEDELAVFEQAALSKTALAEYYTRQEQVLPDGRIAVTYHKRPDAESMVRRLQLILTPGQKLHQLQAQLQDKNWLFFTRRNVQLEADPATGNISAYSVEGVQKLIIGDTLHYYIDARL